MLPSGLFERHAKVVPAVRMTRIHLDCRLEADDCLLKVTGQYMHTAEIGPGAWILRRQFRCAYSQIDGTFLSAEHQAELGKIPVSIGVVWHKAQVFLAESLGGGWITGLERGIKGLK